MKTQVLWLFFSVFSQLIPSMCITPAHAHPLILGQGNESPRDADKAATLTLAPRFHTFTTEQNYNQTGTLVPTSGFARVTRSYGSLLVTTHWSESWYGFARITWLSTNVDSNFIIGSASGLGDQRVGIGTDLLNEPEGLHINAQLEASIPVYSNTEAKGNATPYLGDGSYDFSLLGFASLPIFQSNFSGLMIEGGAGFTKRSHRFSSAVPWSAFLKKQNAGGFLFGAGFRGNATLATDSTTLLDASSDQNRGAGGSYLINATNPSWIIAHGLLGYELNNKMQIDLDVGTTLYGTNIAQGMFFSMGVRVPLGGTDHNDQINQIPRNRHSVINRKSFEEYDLDSEVTSVNDQLYLVKINRGKREGIEVGQIFDIYQESPNVKRIARAKVSEVKRDEAVLTVVEYFIESWIDEGFVAKRLISYK